jgi:para-nitrobenzyl esterase
MTSRRGAPAGRAWISRRRLLQAAGLLALGGPRLPANADQTPGPGSERPAELIVDTDVPVIEIESGRLQGYGRAGVLIWKGVPYAGAATGTHRFAAPPGPTAWTGVRRALTYGPRCPTLEPALDRSNSVWRFMTPSGPPSDAMEDCLRLNIWAPREPAGRRPVMVWLHPGGFRTGSSQEYLASDGENLARSRGVVVVSLNHRIGPLGYSNLAGIGGDELADSPVVGLLDIVAGLRWIRTNIAAFGGDPERVTLFGQSGGGSKISCLLGMPDAAGLFNHAIIQSGARLQVHDLESSARLTHELLRVLELRAGKRAVEALRALPIDTYLRACDEASRRVRAQQNPVPQWRSPDWWFEPAAGAPSMPHQPGDRDALQRSADIPVICGNTLNEISPSGDDPRLERISWQELEQRLLPELGARTTRAIAAARATDPGWLPIDVLSVLQSRSFRLATVEYCDRATALRAASVYNYIFAWRTPMFDGRPRAFHTSDIAFAFANTDLVPQQTGGGPRPDALATRVSGWWAGFAATGRPSLSRAPEWPPYEPTRRSAMILDDDCRVKEQPDHAVLAALRD